MTNPSVRDSSARKVLAAARQIVTYQIGLPAGCQRVLRFWEPPLVDGIEQKAVFEEFMRAVEGLPIGSERLHWNRNALKEKDVLLERINSDFRDRIFEACWKLIELFAPLAKPE